MIFKCRRKPSPRRGSVLLVVLVIIVLLALGAYTFTEMSVAENEATTAFGRSVLARSFAESGIDVAANALADPAQRQQADPVMNRADLFSAVLMRSADVARGRGRFSVVAPDQHDTSGRTLRFGLSDESGKLNLNTLINWQTNNKLNDDTTRAFFLQLPNMTNDIADAILDWLDADEIPRQYGVESEYYLALPQPYRPANGPLTSLDDLLLVRGVTPALLYGEDLNRNGILDPGEDLNGDGYFDRGWSAYLTIYSAERNLQMDGTLRVNVNQQSLPTLYDQVQAIYGDKTAQFVVAYRINGPGSAAGGRGGGGGGGSGSPSGSGGMSGNSQSASGRSSSANASTTATVNKGGMTIPETGNVTIKSLYQLIGATTRGTINGRNTTITSPWTSNPSTMAQYLPDILDKLSLTDDPFIQGRINVNQAPLQVLLGVNNMTEELAQQIVGAQSQGAATSNSGSAQSPRATTAWLIIEGLVSSVNTMQQLDPYLTARGSVYRAQSVGYFDEGGPAVRLEAVIDGSIDPPRILNLRDLSELGRGFSRQQLGVPSN